MSVNPLFIFSLPRSGSTLLQNMLAAHPEIDTTPEPWILLAPLYALRREGIYAEYSHTMARNAAADFVNALPEDEVDYFRAVGEFGLSLYGKIGTGKYFLDKTPRYHLISRQIQQSFPDARCIYLYRNPLGVLGSILDTWQNFHFFRLDLYQGLDALIKAGTQNHPGTIRVRFEDLVSSPEETLPKLCNWLEIRFKPEMLLPEGPGAIPPGRYGNPEAPRQPDRPDYQGISRDPLQKWKSSLGSSLIRKWYAKRYLDWIGEERMAAMGYDFDQTLNELKVIPVTSRTLFSDTYRFLRGWSAAFFETKLMRDKLGSIGSPERMIPHQ